MAGVLSPSGVTHVSSEPGSLFASPESQARSSHPLDPTVDHFPERRTLPRPDQELMEAALSGTCCGDSLLEEYRYDLAKGLRCCPLMVRMVITTVRFPCHALTG